MIDIIIPSVTTQNERLRDVIMSISRYTKDYNIIPIVSDESCSVNINNGIKKSTTEYISLIDNDIVLCRDWLLHMSMVLDKYKDIGLVSAKIVNMKGMPYNDVYINSPDNMISEVYTIGGTCVLYRKSIGIMMDEKYKGGWWNDTHFACDIFNKGYKIVVDGYVHVKHNCSFTNAYKSAYNNERYFYKKFPDMIREKRITVIKSWEMVK